MPFDFSSTLKQAKGVKADQFIALVENVTDMICSEDGQVGNQTITGRLSILQPTGEALIIGDLHGDIASLVAIMQKSGFIAKLNSTSDATVIFLGDYGDRGANQIELYYTVLSLKAAFPEQIVLLRGNHEGPLDLMASPHDLPLILQQRFKDKGVLAYARLRRFFDCLYNAAYVEGQYLMVHGGLPSATRNLQEIAQANKLHPAKPFLTELLWNDPDDQVKTVTLSPRGAGNLFGADITREVLERIDANILIRGHGFVQEGYGLNHDGKVLTLFSRKGAPYFNAHGAYLDVTLDKKFVNAALLAPYLHQF